MKIILLSLLLINLQVFADSTLNLEVGHADSSYNKVKIPGDSGTLFNLAPALESRTYYRLSFIRQIASRHGLRFLYAPLKFSGSKSFSKDIEFKDAIFNSNQKTKTKYKFDSYRATYFFELINTNNLVLKLGGTLKLRDAEIELKQGSKKKSKVNTGFVPLLYLNSTYTWDNGFKMTFDFDGLAAPQGRAFDMALIGGYNISSSLATNIGFRMLEGGVDNDEVFNFSQVNYLFGSIDFHF